MLQVMYICRQDTEDDHSQLELQVQLERSQHVQSKSARSLAAAQSALAEAKAGNEQLQQTVHDLQRHKQDRGREDLQARFKEVSVIEHQDPKQTVLVNKPQQT